MFCTRELYCVFVQEECAKREKRGTFPQAIREIDRKLIIITELLKCAFSGFRERLKFHSISISNQFRNVPLRTFYLFLVLFTFPKRNMSFY